MPAATQPDSRSPSPAPPPPIADAPGPRAQGLINIFNQAVDATLKKCSPANFASCFPTAAEQAPEVLESLRAQVLNQLHRTWKLNFDEIMANKNVVQLLNSLDQCIEDARLRKKRAEANGGPVETPIAPHTLQPAEIHLVHLMPFLETQQAKMNARLVETQQVNAQLLSTVTAQRVEIEALVHGLESVIHDLETSAQMMGQEEVQGLSKEMRELETEMNNMILATWAHLLQTQNLDMPCAVTLKAVAPSRQRCAHDHAEYPRFAEDRLRYHGEQSGDSIPKSSRDANAQLPKNLSAIETRISRKRSTLGMGDGLSRSTSCLLPCRSSAGEGI